MESKALSVCFMLGEGKFPKDDTMVEKFVSFLENHDSTLRDLTFHPELPGFLSSLAQEKITNSLAASAVLRVLGLLCQEHFEKIDSSNQLLSKIIDKQMGQVDMDKSLAYGLLVCFKYICRDRERVHWFLSKGYCGFLQDCLERDGLFIYKTATELMAQIMLETVKVSSHTAITNAEANGDVQLNATEEVSTTSLQNTINGHNDSETVEVSTDLKVESSGKCENGASYSTLYNFFCSYVMRMRALDVRAIKIGSDLITALCDHLDMKNVSDFIVNRCNIPSLIVEILPRVSDSQVKSCLDILSKLQSASLLHSTIVTGILTAATTLQAHNQDLTLVSLCSWILQNCPVHSNDAIEMLLKQLEFCLDTGLDALDVSRKVKTFCRCLGAMVPLNEQYTKVLTIVCSVLTTEDGMSSSTALTRNDKVRQTCIDALNTLVIDASHDDLLLVMKTCSKVLESTAAKFQIVSKALKCLLSTLNQMTQLRIKDDSSLSAEMSGLESFLTEKLLNMKWEIRDSALEFAGGLASIAEGFPCLTSWLQKQNLVSHIWQGVEDGESYVRASGITALQHWIEMCGTRSLLLVDLSEDTIFTKIEEIVRTDTEAFPRRVAIDFLATVFHKDIFPTRSNTILKVMADSIEDLDWEVKIRVLQFWENYIQMNLEVNDESVPDYAVGLFAVKRDHQETNKKEEMMKMLDKFCNCGVAKVLFSGIWDYDRSVQHKTCTIMKQLVETLNKYGCFDDDGTTIPKKARISEDSTCEMGTNHNITENNENVDQKFSKDVPKLSSKIVDPASIQTAKSFLEALHNLDIDSLLKQSGCSTDAYAENFEALLDDLGCALSLYTEEATGEDNAPSIDCY